MDLEFRHTLLDIGNEDDFKRHLHDRMTQLIAVQGLPENRKSQPSLSVFDEDDAVRCRKICLLFVCFLCNNCVDQMIFLFYFILF